MAKFPKKEELIRENEELLQTKLAMLNLLEDIEDEKRKIAEEKAKTEALVSSIHEAIIALDAKGRITYQNAMAEQLIGDKAKAWLGKSISNIPLLDRNHETYGPERRPALTVLKEGASMSVPLAYFGKRKTPVSITLSPMFLGGKISGVVMAVRDIAKEREEAEMKENFLALVTHQLRSPLGSIRWYAEILSDKDLGPLDDEQHDFVERIQHGVGRLIETVDALLALAKIEGGLIVESKKPVDLCELAKDALEVERDGIAGRRLRVSVVCAPKTIGIKVNATLLRQVIGNVISNAVRYSKSGGKIAIAVRPGKDAAIFEVKDQGIGIPEREQKKLFTQFYRASNAKEYAPQGSGLGLMLVKKIVETIGGTVGLVSKVNRGTTVTIVIPKR